MCGSGFCDDRVIEVIDPGTHGARFQIKGDWGTPARIKARQFESAATRHLTVCMPLDVRTDK